jgi:Zn ribbon nucleic-acid-binding protein
MAKKIVAKKCPHCTDEVLVQLKDGQIEVFECKNCKFRVKKNEK